MLSPVSALPTVPPALLVVVRDVAVGFVLSTVTVNPPVVAVCALESVAVIENVFAPFVRPPPAVRTALR
jgi:hypothetical protein